MRLTRSNRLVDAQPWLGWLVLGFFLAALPRTRAVNGLVTLELTAREEQLRWLANRARFDPRRENQRLKVAFNVPQGPLPPLALSQPLVRAARNHAADLTRARVFDHPSPAESTHYAPGTTPAGRGLQEGYRSDRYGENIAAGHLDAITTHDDWWLSTPHRTALVQADYLEIGVGYAESPASLYGTYTVQNLGRERNGTRHFFTDTCFHDRNGNGRYDEGEGVGGIELHVEAEGQPISAGDRSRTHGGFAVAIEPIADQASVSVHLANRTDHPQELDIPIDYANLRHIRLQPGEIVTWATFQQPRTRTNLGWRSLQPTSSDTRLVWSHPTLHAIRWDTNLVLFASATLGRNYQLWVGPSVNGAQPVHFQAAQTTLVRFQWPIPSNEPSLFLQVREGPPNP